MDLGMVGLGRMGGNMAVRLVRGGHRVVGFSRSAETRRRAAQSGVVEAESVESLIQLLPPPRAVWLMLPAGQPTDDMLAALLPLLSAGDCVIDGGNAHYKDSLRRAEGARGHAVRFVDVGTSGGVWGLDGGYSLMIGGDEQDVARLRPLFETLAPAPDRGWGRVGPVGAGHFAKMVHNGIEYGMMQAYAEGFSLLKRKTDFGFDLGQVADIWRDGSVVRSWLLDLAAQILREHPDLSDVLPSVADSGEGRWAVAEAIDLDVPAPVTALALLMRLRSRDCGSFSDRLLAALRHQFGGHTVVREQSDGR